MFLAFLDLYGAPVLIRPELVAGLRGIASYVHGKPVRGTFVLLDNRETFRIQGDVEAVGAAIEAWHDEQKPKALAGPHGDLR